MLISAPQDKSIVVLAEMAMSAQQTVEYVLTGFVNNHFTEKFFTEHGLFPCHGFKVHLGSTGSNENKRVMGIYVIMLHYFQYRCFHDLCLASPGRIPNLRGPIMPRLQRSCDSHC
jgi:hypothetical protein